MRQIRQITLTAALVVAALSASTTVVFAQPAADPAAGGDAETALPAGFKPPAPVPDAMKPEFGKQLISHKDVEAFRKDPAKYLASLKALGGSRTAAGDVLIDELAHWFVYQFSLKELRIPTDRRSGDFPSFLSTKYIHDVRNDIVRTILLNARGEARIYFLERLARYCEDLFDNNFQVRLNAVILLTQLNTEDPPLQANPPPAVPFLPAARPLMRVVADPDQLDAVKVPAVVGLIRISHDGKPDAAVPRQDIAKACNGELQENGLHTSYQVRLIEALAAAGVASSDPTSQEPDVVKTLLKILYDQKTPWPVRAEAARAVGRVSGGTAQTTANAVFGIVKLGDEMAVAYNQNPRAYYWKLCFLNLYLAFKPINGQDPVRQGSFLDRFSSGSRDIVTAYESLLPTVQYVVNATTTAGIPAERLEPIKKWLTENAASSYQPKTANEPATSQGEANPAQATRPSSAG